MRKRHGTLRGGGGMKDSKIWAGKKPRFATTGLKQQLPRGGGRRKKKKIVMALIRQTGGAKSKRKK